MLAPERFSNLPEYAWPRLRALLDVDEPGAPPVQMGIGEPQHLFPHKVAEIVSGAHRGFNRYPPNNGSEELLTAITEWIARRYGANVEAETQLMALNGTREGLFNAVIALCPETKASQQPLILMPNPFYQVYMVAALTVGAEPRFIPATQETGFLPDFAALGPEVLDRTAIVFLCSPSNPQGAVASQEYLVGLLNLAEKHDFLIFADECYSEIYRGNPPPGILEVANQTNADPDRVVAFHSLSKRSNLPGLRSGFVAAGAGAMSHIRQLRAYAGAPLPLPLQEAAAWCWSDDRHVAENRALYQAKYEIADAVMAGVPGFEGPEGGFFLWLNVSDGEAAASKLWREHGVRCLPGAYLAQTVGGQNPGQSYIRAAMVAPAEEFESGLIKIRACLYE